MSYVVGFVAAVPTANKETYRRHAAAVGAVFKEFGALQYMECWREDVPEGMVTSFPQAVQCKDDETVVFSWMVWPSREAHEEGMSKAMKDPRVHPDKISVPFDPRRAIFGRFETIVEL